jgi:transcriptional regulator with XRE-family HTH domain
MSGRPRHDRDDRGLFHEAMGAAIRRRRDAAGLSQRKLGEVLRVSHALIDKWEHGVTPPPSYIVWKLAHLFDCSADDLMVDPSAEVAA